MFISSKPTTPGPDRELEQEISAAHEKVTLDAPSEERKKLHAILATNHDAFATHANQLGTCPLDEHSVDVRDSIPVASRTYRYSFANREFMRKEVTDYWERGGIVPSQSDTPVIVQPNDPATPMKMVHDYGKLNAKTVNPPYPTPLMEDDLDHIMDKDLYTRIEVIYTRFLQRRTICSRTLGREHVEDCTQRKPPSQKEEESG
ncbi:hypothetical protein MTO96_026171 [Rhipicephalus appendiculatus]